MCLHSVKSRSNQREVHKDASEIKTALSLKYAGAQFSYSLAHS